MAWLFSDMWQWLAGAAAILAALVGARWKWKRSAVKDERARAALAAAEARNKTLTEIRKDRANAETQDDVELVRRLTDRGLRK